MRHIFRILVVLSLFCAGNVFADETTAMKNKWVAHADIIGGINPPVAAVVGGVFFRHPYAYSPTFEDVWSHIEVGAHAVVSPAYAQLAARAVWMPILPILLHLQYDMFQFFGANGALLSFDSAKAQYNYDQVTDRAGEEETGIAHRVLLRPTLRAQFGQIIIMNNTDLVYYHFEGKGPYFFDWEYDALLEGDDFIVDNRTELLIEAWKDGDAACFMMGPYYHVTQTVWTGNRRQRLGWEMMLIPSDKLGSLGQFRIYTQIGANLEDRNWKNQLYAILGIGSDWTI
jgi:hypothetical protein